MRKGNLQARAIKAARGWRLTELTLELTQPDEHINVLSRPLYHPCTRIRPCRSSPSPVCLQIIDCGFWLRSSDLPVLRIAVPKLAVQGRYNMGVQPSVLTGSLQGITERPLPCNYNVIQFVCALSRR